MLGKKRFQKREKLLNIALIEFEKYGYDQASLNKIIEKTGIAKMTFYYHYEGKEELFLSIVDEIIEKLQDFINVWLDKYPDFIKGKSFLDILEIYCKVSINFIEENSMYYNFIKRACNMDNLDIRKKVQQKFANVVNKILKDMFNIAYEKKQFRQDIDKDSLFRYLEFNILFLLKEIVYTLKEIDIKGMNKIIEDNFKILKSALDIKK